MRNPPFWKGATILTLLLLLAQEIYSGYDVEWTLPAYISTFITLQYIEVACSFAYFFSSLFHFHDEAQYEASGQKLDIKATKGYSVALVSLYINVVCIITGLKASFATAYTLSGCESISDGTVERAKSCIDVYSSYASLDGPFGLTTACASLDTNVQSYMGGVCPNVNRSGGTALLVTQMLAVMIITLLNIAKATIYRGEVKVIEEHDSGSGYSSSHYIAAAPPYAPAPTSRYGPGAGDTEKSALVIQSSSPRSGDKKMTRKPFRAHPRF